MLGAPRQDKAGIPSILQADGAEELNDITPSQYAMSFEPNSIQQPETTTHSV